ncbi:MAG TPA: FHA domain-containing protein [Chloroflexi bacterium]|nr:FHA domain-containing protein [Chloroflexota bacterium]
MKEELIGETFGQYEITGVIGEGGMGVVYRARDTKLQRDVALKVLPLDTAHLADAAQNEELLKRFTREANAAAGLDHPSIIDIYNLDTKDDVYYIAMRYVEGRTLSQLMREEGPLPLERAAHIVDQLASALDYAHRRQVIHRDVKPANIMVGPDDRVTLMDFGIAKAPSKEKLTRVGQVMGTIEYMSPEQFQGKPVDARADVYALGIVLYQMLTGEIPFSSQALLSDPSIFGSPPPPRQHNPRISEAVEQVILRGLSESPGARYQTAVELAAGLRAALGEPEAARAPAPSPMQASAAIPLKLVFPNGYEQELTPGLLCLGRSADNDMIFRDDRVSRRHAEIHCKEQHGCAIVDLGSANGTYVNGRQLRPEAFLRLEPGMQIHLGPNVKMRVQEGAVPRREDQSHVWPTGSPDTTKNDGEVSHSIISHPTRVIAQAAARLDDRQIGLIVASLVILAVGGVWLGAPIWRQISFAWFNIPLIGVVGASIYAATRRPWGAALAHGLIAFIGGVVLWGRLEIYTQRYPALLLGAIGSGLFIYGWLKCLPRVTGGEDRASGAKETPWREAVWLALMATLAVAILYGTVNIYELRRVGQWFGAAATGVVGWFLGDVVRQYLTLRAEQKGQR